jgi:two-component system chemotaxis response regulator CheB
VPERDVVVVGASAGGVEALRELVRGLPTDLPAAVLVVLHMPPSGTSALARVLAGPSPLPVAAAVEGAPLRPGTVTVAVPNRHLLVVPGDRMTLSLGPRENGHRPSVDALFRSAAHAAGPRVVGVVLSGVLDDGAAGLAAVAARGGVGVVQDPADAVFDSMPRHALLAVPSAEVVAARAVGSLLAKVCGVAVPADPDVADLPTETRQEIAMSQLDGDSWGADDHPGTSVPLTCPDCHGPLFQLHEAPPQRFRCLVGHGWSAESLAAQQSSAVEGALWMALRSLEEKAELSRSMADRAEASGHELSGRSFRQRADDAHRAALLVRDLLERAGHDDGTDEAAGSVGDGVA